MSNEIATVEAPSEAKPIEERGVDLHLVAETPAEMKECQAGLIEWCKWKIQSCQEDAKELQEATDHAVKQKWSSGTLKRHAANAVKRVQYYEKILGALEAGYYIVPNFPVSMFAIRTKKNDPTGKETNSHWGAVFEQKATGIGAGEGEYKNPFPAVYQENVEVDGKDGKAQTVYFPGEWKDLEFPVSMAKPKIMEMVDRAMALKVFDEFGILPAKPKQDPLIVGRVKLKTGPYAEKIVTFIVAWHLNTRDL